MPIKLIGRTNNFCGKTLWEIIGNLKNFGVGRIVVRSVFERYPEPCYMKIVKVEPLTNEETRKVRVWVEKTFRGRHYPKLAEICSTSYKADYKLIPKSQEEEYCKLTTDPLPELIVPQSIGLPPLLNAIILNEKIARGENVDGDTLQVPLKIKQLRDNRARLAKDGETPNVLITPGLGKPVSPELYKGVEL